MSDDFRKGEVGCFNVKVALHYLKVGGDGAEEVVGFFVGEVAEAEDLAYFVGGEEFFELRERSSVKYWAHWGSRAYFGWYVLGKGQYGL